MVVRVDPLSHVEVWEAVDTWQLIGCATEEVVEAVILDIQNDEVLDHEQWCEEEEKLHDKPGASA